eukprot:g9133.t1
MHLSVGRSMAMVSMATALRGAAGFVGHVRVGSKFSAGVMRMSAAAASHVPRAGTAVPVLDAQAAELKAERLWGMADAQKPVSIERKNGMPEMAVERVTARSLIADASGERGTSDFIEGPSETSALRRYQYTEQLAEDGDVTDDDGNEYYI